MMILFVIDVVNIIVRIVLIHSHYIINMRATDAIGVQIRRERSL
jgi:hypothetical protein